MRLFCCGYGYVAKHMAQDLRAQGWQVQGTSRRAGQADFMLDDDMPLNAAGQAALQAATHVLVSIPPGPDGDDAAWRHHGAMMAGKWIGYLSTTGVYGDWQGAWVDEQSPLKATEPRSLRRISAERHWQEAGAAIFRLAGIYGPNRNVLQQIENGAAQRIDKPGQYFSRIHVEDIVQVLHAAIAQDMRREVFNLCDDEPSPSHEVIAYGCALLGVPVPPLVPYEQAQLSPMAQSFYAANRRVRNDKIKKLLGVSLRHASYRQGLASILHNMHNTG